VHLVAALAQHRRQPLRDHQRHVLLPQPVRSDLAGIAAAVPGIDDDDDARRRARGVRCRAARLRLPRRCCRVAGAARRRAPPCGRQRRRAAHHERAAAELEAVRVRCGQPLDEELLRQPA
jgi:hypothetical protein